MENADRISPFSIVRFQFSIMPIDWKNVRRVLVVRLRSIGDTVLATPSLISLKRFLPDAEFIQAVGRRYGGIPPALLDHQELVDIVVPALRADLTIFETYVYHHEPPLEWPIAAFAGRDDRNVDEAMLHAWQGHTRDKFSSLVFPGGHFFLQHERPALMAALRPVLLGP